MREETKAMLLRSVLIPVLRSHSDKDARGALDCLRNAGFQSVEITMTVNNALGLIREAKNMGFCTGAGTVFDTECAADCIGAGASFIVSPVRVPGLANLCHEKDVLCMEGAVTPGEIRDVIQDGADIVKIFPASIGGPGYISALRDIFPEAVFCPTGGVSADNLGAFLKAGADLLGAGGSLFDFAAIAAGDAGRATERMRSFLRALPSGENR